MDMFKLYGCTKEEIYDMLDYFNIFYLYDVTDLTELQTKLYDVISAIEDERIESEYSIERIEEVITTLEYIILDGYTLANFRK